MTLDLSPDTLAGIIAGQVRARPDFEILRFENGDGVADTTRTFNMLWQNAHHVAGALLSQGMRPGQYFALMMENHPDFVEAMIAAGLTRTLFVPVDPRVSGDKLAYLLNSTDCKGVIAADQVRSSLEAIRPQLPDDFWILPLGLGEIRSPRPAALTDFTPASADDAMQILFTSGTTGDPKGIVISHGMFAQTSRNVGSIFGYGEGDRLYTGLSLTHSNAQMITLGASLALGLPAVISRRFTKSRLWDIVRNHRCTSFTLLGGMTNAIFCEPVRHTDADNTVRLVISAGMPRTIWNEFESRFGVSVFEFYGTAEGGVCAVNPPGEGPAGSIGRVLPELDYRIVDAEGHDVPRGHSGELWTRKKGPVPFMVRYLNNPRASAEKVVDGWFRSGDVLHEEDGWLFFDYRSGGGVRRNGAFLNLKSVEQAIAASGLADDVYVYGRDAASGVPGEKDLIGVVVPKSERLDPASLWEHLETALDGNHVPSFLQVVGAIPKTASEKPVDRVLLEQFQSAECQVFARPGFEQ